MKKILILLSVLALTSATAFAQYTAKGVVEDKFGPVIGAAVIQVGTSNGVQTDIDGQWSLTVPSASTLIEISFLKLSADTPSCMKVRTSFPEGKTKRRRPTLLQLSEPALPNRGRET